MKAHRPSWWWLATLGRFGFDNCAVVRLKQLRVTFVLVAVVVVVAFVAVVVVVVVVVILQLDDLLGVCFLAVVVVVYSRSRIRNSYNISSNRSCSRSRSRSRSSNRYSFLLFHGACFLDFSIASSLCTVTKQTS